MCGKAFIYAINTASQTITANNFVAFNTTPAQRMKCISFLGTNNFAVKCAGSYRISFDADINSTGAVAVNILDNGVTIATGTITGTATTGSTEHLHLQALIVVRPSCKAINNTNNIQIQMVNGATVTNPSIIIEGI